MEPTLLDTTIDLIVTAVPSVANAIVGSTATITTALLSNELFRLSLVFTFVMIGFSIVFGTVKKISKKRV
jgi:hypothetical protein